MPPAQFRKILYKKQPFPDNHTDPTFLSDLVTPPTPPTSILQPCINLAQRSAVTALYVASFMLLSPSNLIYYTIPSLITCALSPKSVLIVSCVVGSSPILSTLTADIASDSIYRSVGVLLAVHLAAGGSVGVNSGLLAGVLLASRVEYACSVVVLNAMVCFAWGPRVWNGWPGVCCATAFLVYFVWIDVVLAFLLVACWTALVVGGPWLFSLLGRYKRGIRGPWDEAVLSAKKLD